MIPRTRSSHLAACCPKASVLRMFLPIIFLFMAGAAAFGAAWPTTTQCGDIESAILGRPVDYCVDLPAGYAASSKQRYPVLYFLHGLFEHDTAWIDHGGKDVLDGMLRDGRLGPFIVVLPDADNTFYVNSYDGKVRYEDFFIQELVPYIDRHYRTIPTRLARGISGVSMGGYGALHLAMLHPDVFGTVSAQGAALIPKFPHPVPTQGRWGFYARVLQHAFGDPLSEADWDANNPLTLAEHPSRFRGLKMYFDCGDHDRYGFEAGAEMLNRILDSKHFPHQFYLRPGDHGWPYLRKYLQDALLFHWKYFQQAEREYAAKQGAR
jgi:S-formylglutathione hydrolase FrmB